MAAELTSPAPRVPPARVRVRVAVLVAATALVGLGTIGLGYLGYRLAVGVFGGEVRLRADLKARALSEYPECVLIRMRYEPAQDPKTGADEARFFFRFRDPACEGFTFAVCYYAPTKKASRVTGYDNADSFFRAGSSRQPVESFKRMWASKHPDTLCEWVFELGDSFDATRTYEIGYSLLGDDPQRLTAYAGFVRATKEWIDFTSDPTEDVWGSAQQLETPMIGSEIDTPAAVAQVLSEFEPISDYMVPGGDWHSVVRRRIEPHILLDVIPSLLAYSSDDPMIDLFMVETVRSKAFAAYWQSRHPATVITSISTDPDTTGDVGLVSVWYSTDTKQPENSWLDQEEERLRYDQGSGTWRRVN